MKGCTFLLRVMRVSHLCVWDVGCADDCVCNLCGCSEPGVDDDAEQYEQRLEVREF